MFSTRGLGKALAREFLLSGDRVVVASRRLSLKLLMFDSLINVNMMLLFVMHI